MAFFDATLFTVVPAALPGARCGARPADRAAPGPASDTGRTGTRPPRVGRSCNSGSWIGGDRDGNPGVTAEITTRTLRIQADHVLRGYEAVATRLMQTVAAAAPGRAGRAGARLAPGPRRRRPARDRPPASSALPRRAVPPAVRVHRRAAAPDAGRAGRGAGAADRTLRIAPPTLDAELVEISGRARRRRPRAGRLGRGRRAALAGRDVRLPPRLARGPPARGGPSAARSPRSGPAPPGRPSSSPGVTLDEVLATFRAIAAAQARFGREACHRYVISFTLGRVGRDRRPRAGRRGRAAAGRRDRRRRDRRRARRRPALRIERGARRRRRDPRRAARRSRPIAPTWRPAAIARK